MQSCLICDDHALVREALTGTVRMIWPDIAIDEAGDFPTAWEKAAKAPGLILADLMMPGADPFAGIDGIMTAAPEARVLIITGNQDDPMLMRLLARGVAGFAPKSATGAIIEAALRLIAAGGLYLPPRLAEIAAGRLMAQGPATANADFLTGRQREVLDLVTRGKTNKEIARTLQLAPSTVKSHISQIFDRIGAVNRTDALVKARALNLLGEHF